MRIDPDSAMSRASELAGVGRTGFGWAAGVAARSGVYYGWLVVAVTFLALLVAAGIRGLPGIVIKPLEDEFGWDRASISLTIAVSLFAYGLAGPLSGRLLNSLGPRRVLLGGLVVTALGSAAMLPMGSLIELTLWWGVVVGLGSGTVAFVLAATVATRWFVARRGLVTGILGAGASAGQLVFVPAMMALTVASGWRAAVGLGIAVIGLLVLPLAALLMRNRPSDVGLEPLGAGQLPAGAASTAGPVTPFAQALRTGDFWLLAGSFFICGFTTNGLIGTHLIPHALEHGFSAGVAATSLAVIGAMNVVGTMLSGVLTDRFNPRLLLAVYYGVRAMSLVMLPFVGDVLGLTVFAVLFGLDYIATVPPTVALTADRFGQASVPILFGWIICGHQLGAAAATYLGGLMHVWFGDYQLAFISAGLLAFVAAGLSLRVRGAAKGAALPTTA